MIDLEGSMSNGDKAGWVCPTFASGVLTLSSWSCKQGEGSKGVSGGGGKGTKEVEQRHAKHG